MLTKGAREVSWVIEAQLCANIGNGLVTAAKQVGGVNQAALVTPAENTQARTVLEQCCQTRRRHVHCRGDLFQSKCLTQVFFNKAFRLVDAVIAYPVMAL